MEKGRNGGGKGVGGGECNKWWREKWWRWRREERKEKEREDIRTMKRGAMEDRMEGVEEGGSG